MDFKTLESIKANGFEGFKKISDLNRCTSSIPKDRGIYLVLYVANGIPNFLPVGVGGFFKGKNPNVTLNELARNWVEDTIVIYIGQAGGIRAGKWSNQTLNDRISAYLKFGNGQNIAHYGGRYIWQIKDYKNLVICWKPLLNKILDPKKVETQMIADFKQSYNKRPFANLQD